jgi:hypothetical protein
MPRAYKICLAKEFNVNAFSQKPLVFGTQQHLKGVESGPVTKIFVSRDSAQSIDFKQFKVEHEREESAIGRVNGIAFTKFIRMGVIDLFWSTSLKLILLSGKKRDILDFCKKYRNGPDFSFETISIDMSQLLKLLPSVKGVWFSFPQGHVRASLLWDII